MLAYRCPKCGFKDFDPGPCALCGKPMKSYKAGSPPKEPLQAGSATGCAPFKRHYSPIHGRQLNSWSEYRRANKELGLIDVGHKPELPHVEKLAETSAGYIAND